MIKLSDAAKAAAATIAVKQHTLVSPIEIIVAGGIHCGKTNVVALIEAALADAGFLNVSVIGPEEDAERRKEMAERFKADINGEDEATLLFLGKSINIREASPDTFPQALLAWPVKPQPRVSNENYNDPLPVKLKY